MRVETPGAGEAASPEALPAEAGAAAPAPIRFEAHPERYRHWRLEVKAGEAVARLVLDVREGEGIRPGYPLKLNSYDLGVDIELADALQRVRFEHPSVQAIVVSSGKDRVFSSGANIYMLGASTHHFKVNFCKFTNETRLGLEEMSAESGVSSIAALAGTASGGGYELALACDEIVLVDDGSSAVSLPEAPLLAVLPGTGGLTRLVDKRKVRRDLADVFATTAEGVRGKRAVEWGLVDEAPAKKAFEAAVARRTSAMAARGARRPAAPIALAPLEVARTPSAARYRYVSLEVDAARRTASLIVRAPSGAEPETPEALAAAGSAAWTIQVWRELDDALLDLRFNHPTVGVVAVRTAGDGERVVAVDRMLAAHAGDGLVHEATLLARRVLKRMDNTAKTFFALVEPGSAFAGSLLELALASDRVYMLDHPEQKNEVRFSPMNGGALPMSNGLSRLRSRFLRDPDAAASLLAAAGPLDAKAALAAGIATFAPDEIDWADEVRIAFEERTSLSPDAMTGMEANLRYGGPETMETKIFGRLSAWQNWIFQRPNAVGPHGALSLYGRPERPERDFTRT
ncbi:MAG TPA: 2,3-epoxybenzoyl-CoA dihydrolase [Polyangiaceae bacterium]|jgi:benzoyl-CoA-dihydrodiol lyase